MNIDSLLLRLRGACGVRAFPLSRASSSQPLMSLLVFQEFQLPLFLLIVEFSLLEFLIGLFILIVDELFLDKFSFLHLYFFIIE